MEAVQAHVGQSQDVGADNLFSSAVNDAGKGHPAPQDLSSLQLVLRQIVLQNQVNDLLANNVGTTIEDSTNLIAETIKYAVIMVAVIPILCVYPFIQKYFVKGTMVGSIKG